MVQTSMVMLEKVRGDEEVMGRFSIQNWNVEGQMVVNLSKRMEIRRGRNIG